jgi:phosphoglycolate phosphatase
MIGDTTFDMEMATRADTMALGVSWGYHPEEQLKAAGAHVVINAFDELPEAIETLGKVST